MLICRHCGVANPDNSPYCSACGAPYRSAFGVVTGIKETIRALASSITPTSWPVTGVDISYHNGTIDFRVMAQRATFTLLRAGYNNANVDPKLTTYYPQIVQTPLFRGLYWYCVVGQDYHAHARSFFNQWKNFPTQITPMLDFEYTSLNPFDTTAWIKAMVFEFAGLTGKLPMIYTSPGWWNAHVLRNDWAHNCMLDVAHWTTANTPLVPYDWSNYNIKPTMWQYSADNNRMGAYYGSTNGDPDMDLQRFYGTIADFDATFGITDPVITPPPPPAFEPVKVLYQAKLANATALNIRALPDATSQDIGTILPGTEFPIVQEYGNWVRVEGWVNKNFIERI